MKNDSLPRLLAVFNKKKVRVTYVLAMAAFMSFLFVSSATGEANQRYSPVVRAVQRVSAAVVNISSAYEPRNRGNPFSGLGLDPFFESFFRDFLDPESLRRPKRSHLGSGVIIDGKRGFIITNAHVIENSGTILVALKDSREYEAQAVGIDPDSDLAVLKIPSDGNLPEVKMGRSDDLMIGETVIAIGNPFGFSHTVTTGVISATNRSVRTDNRIYQDFIQIDASINPGNSGGPLLNINGDLIGINTAIYAKAQGIGFAIPIDKAKRIVSDLIQYGEVVHPWIGIVPQKLNRRLAKYLDLPKAKGIIVKEIEPSSPAFSAGIESGDLLVDIDKQIVTSIEKYYDIINGLSLGQTAVFHILRSGEEKHLRVATIPYPLDRAMKLSFGILGIKVTEISDLFRQRYNIKASHGVIITEIHPDAYLSRIGVRKGDIIRQLNDVSIQNLDQYKRAIVKFRRKKSLVLLVQRGEQGYYITVKF